MLIKSVQTESASVEDKEGGGSQAGVGWVGWTNFLYTFEHTILAADSVTDLLGLFILTPFPSVLRLTH